MLFRIKNLHYHTIKSTTFAINDAECIGLFGPSGSGKSLLLRALADLDPHDGDILLHEKSVHEHKPHEWRKKVGLLPAESQWWFDAVGDHFTNYDEKNLSVLGFEKSVMQWEISRLSSGEKQRLALLRMLANHPAVLLLDEPTANLDPRFVGHVESMLKEYQTKNKAALLWVSHDRGQLERVADRIFEIRNQMIQEVKHG